MRWNRDLYQSPRVIRAVLEDLMEDLAEALYLQRADYALLHYAANTIESYLQSASYRGTPLNRLITVDPVIEGNSLVFHFRKLSDDGDWLLRQLDMIHDTPQVPKAHTEKLEVKRVVDL